MKFADVPSPRGVAFDRSPADNAPWVYIGTATDVRRSRVFDGFIYLDIKLLNEARQPGAGVGRQLTQAEFQAAVEEEVTRANAMLQQCGVQLVAERIVFMNDPNGLNGVLPTNGHDPLNRQMSQEEKDLFATNRSPATKRINVYYIHHATQSGVPTSTFGVTYTNDNFDFPAGGTNDQYAAIVRSRYAWNGTSFYEAPVESILAHEVTHFLMNVYADPDGDNQDEHHGSGSCQDPRAPNLMFKWTCPGKWRLEAAQCTAAIGNTDESTFVEFD